MPFLRAWRGVNRGVLTQSGEQFPLCIFTICKANAFPRLPLNIVGSVKDMIHQLNSVRAARRPFHSICASWLECSLALQWGFPVRRLNACFQPTRYVVWYLSYTTCFGYCHINQFCYSLANTQAVFLGFAYIYIYIYGLSICIQTIMNHGVTPVTSASSIPVSTLQQLLRELTQWMVHLWDVWIYQWSNWCPVIPLFFFLNILIEPHTDNWTGRRPFPHQNKCLPLSAVML